jgi:hypothetical protein
MPRRPRRMAANCESQAKSRVVNRERRRRVGYAGVATYHGSPGVSMNAAWGHFLERLTVSNSRLDNSGALIHTSYQKQLLMSLSLNLVL